MSPIFHKIADEMPDIVFAQVDVDQCQDVSQECSVSCMPTFQLFKGGNMISKLEGADEGMEEFR